MADWRPRTAQVAHVHTRDNHVCTCTRDEHYGARLVYRYDYYRLDVSWQCAQCTGVEDRRNITSLPADSGRRDPTTGAHTVLFLIGLCVLIHARVRYTHVYLCMCTRSIVGRAQCYSHPWVLLVPLNLYARLKQDLSSVETYSSIQWTGTKIWA